MLTAFAPAKVNLFLHVGAVQADGYHPICSLITFADIGDRLSLAPADHPAFDIDGEFASGLDPNADNLVVQAWRGLMAKARGPQAPCRVILTKALPIAAGLGGGSSDAGAALRLLRNGLGVQVDDAGLERIAASLGADGAACFVARPVIAQGRGERLGPAPGLPPIDAVLVNPRVPCSTAAVYRAFDAAGGGGDLDLPPLPDAFDDVQELAAVLSFCRNDLETPAISVAPVIGEVLNVLRAEPETLLARVSGSGATCFALTASEIEAEGLVDTLSRLRPEWWVRRCRLGGPWPD